MIKKRHIIPFFDRIHPLIPLDFLIKKNKNLPFLPFYHVIGNPSELPHIKNLYTAKTAKQFEKDLDFILKKFKAIDLKSLISFSRGELNIKQPFFHLSFDDGLREVYEIALPILEKKGIPATIFINSDFVDNKDLFFRYKVSLIINKLSEEEKKLKNKLLHFNSTHIQDINKIGKEKGVDFDKFLTDYQPYMNIKQLEDCIKRGFTLGGHSESHPYYSNINLEQQKKQTINSIDFLNNKLNIKYKSFAFPFSDDGVSNNFFNHIFTEKDLDISFGTSGVKKDEIDFHFQRLGMEKNIISAKKIIGSEYAYFTLLKIFNRHIRTRT